MRFVSLRSLNDPCGSRSLSEERSDETKRLTTTLPDER
jgi:hypothetical protein